ncbi:MAG: ASCH domain-containing protein [Treponematales bacterium]
MKALTVKNPWAWLIIHGEKDVENRSWRTNYRGRLLIHASKRPEEIEPSLPGQTTAEEIILLSALGESEPYNGCILGSVELADCVLHSKSAWAEEGAWHWILRNPVPFDKPIPAKGSLWLWDYNE